jgi:hypothetical protein
MVVNSADRPDVRAVLGDFLQIGHLRSSVTNWAEITESPE